MKKFLFLAMALLIMVNLQAIEVYKSIIYPGAINHQISSYSFGLFSLNTMESSKSAISIKRTIAFNNSSTLYQYTYDNEGRLKSYSRSFSKDGGEFVNEGQYEYEYKEDNLSSATLNGESIYFPTPFFITFRQGGDELFFDLERDDEDNISAYVQRDKNGTKYFIRDGLLRSIESIGIEDDKSQIQYEYDENSRLKRYRSEVTEGRGLSRKVERYDFQFSDGIIQSFMLEKSGQGQDYYRVRCEYEHITEEDGTPVMSFALDDDGNIILTGKYEYESSGRYTLTVLDSRDTLLETIEVEEN